MGAGYQFGSLKLAGNYANTIFRGYGTCSTMNVYEFGGTNRFLPAFSGTLAEQYTTLEGHHWTQGTLGVDYHLSKRTDIYAFTDYMKASSGVDAVIAGNFASSTTNTQYDFRIAMWQESHRLHGRFCQGRSRLGGCPRFLGGVGRMVLGLFLRVRSW